MSLTTTEGSEQKREHGVDSRSEQKREHGVDSELTGFVIGAAIEVHKQLGSGLLESAYEDALAYEFVLRGIPFQRQKRYHAVYTKRLLKRAFRADFLVRDKLIVEVKAVTALADIHTAQLITYLKVSGCRLGLIINFNTRVLFHGIKRVIL
jgi:GxxExxY protein